MTVKRWELIRSLCGAGPVTIREAARRVDRDVKAVHGDVHALLVIEVSLPKFNRPFRMRKGEVPHFSRQ
jgi:predicted transcriptional regulator